MRPWFPRRVQRFVYACAQVAAIADGKMKDEAPMPVRKSPRRPRENHSPGGVVLPSWVKG